jgi:hypothetical protein
MTIRFALYAACLVALISIGSWTRSAPRDTTPAQEETRDVGVVTGVVSDSRDGHPISYANVLILGTRFGSMTLDDGSFRISDVPPGTYRIRVMMMRYNSSESDPITVKANGVRRCDFKIEKICPDASRAERDLVGSEVDVDSKDILCEIHPTKDSFKVGDRFEFDVRLQNLTDKTFYLIGCLEESASRSRYPYTYWSVSGPDRCADSSVSMSLSVSDDTLDPGYFVQLQPGSSFDPFDCSAGPRADRTAESRTSHVVTNYSFTKPGHHSVYFTYATLRECNGEWLGPSSLGVIPPKVATLLKQVPRLDLSCSAEFEVEE